MVTFLNKLQARESEKKTQQTNVVELRNINKLKYLIINIYVYFQSN